MPAEVQPRPYYPQSPSVSVRKKRDIGVLTVPVPIEIKSFERESIYFNRSSPDTNEAWRALSGRMSFAPLATLV
jgi:hypothetical protein